MERFILLMLGFVIARLALSLVIGSVIGLAVSRIVYVATGAGWDIAIVPACAIAALVYRLKKPVSQSK